VADVFLKRTLAGFTPADGASENIWRKYKLHEVYRAKITKPRNYKHHCLFMCLLEKTYENQSVYTSDKMFRRAVAREAGPVEELITLDGEVLKIPLSYSYDEIPDEDDFTKAFGAAMTVCASILRVTAPFLEEEISRYADEHYGIECPVIFRTDRAA
jgi:hypothetical protein